MKILLSNACILIFICYCKTINTPNIISSPASALKTSSFLLIDGSSISAETNSSLIQVEEINMWFTLQKNNLLIYPLLIVSSSNIQVLELFYLSFNHHMRFKLKYNPSQAIFSSIFTNRREWLYLEIKIKLRISHFIITDEVGFMLSSLRDQTHENYFLSFFSVPEYPTYYYSLKAKIISPISSRLFQYMIEENVTNIKNYYMLSNRKLKIQQNKKSRLLVDCQSSTFNDGLNCIDSSYYIPNRANLVHFLPLSGDMESSYYIPHNWNQEGSFYLGFQVSSLSTTNLKEGISYIRDGISFLFSIAATYSLSSQIHQICFYSNQILQGCFVVNPRLIWIGLWTDFSTLIITIRNQGLDDFKRLNISKIENMINPVICVGTCFIPNTNVFSGEISSPITFIKGIGDPQNNMKDFSLLKGNPAQLYFQFDSQHILPNTSFEAFNIITDFQESKNYKFIMINTHYHPTSGFGFVYDFGSYATLDNIEFGKEMSFSGYFIPQKKISPIFFQYSMNNLNINYHLLLQPNGSFEVQICIQSTCQQTENCFLQNNAHFFLAIITRNLDESSPNHFFYQFEVVCDFRRNSLIFKILNSNISYLKSSITIPISDNFYSINNIKIILGSVFYFDYTSTNPCFIYYNLVDMKCLKAKSGYTIYHGQVISQNDCFNYSQSSKAVYYNIYIQECYEINKVIPGCLIYDQNLIQCLQCQDPNAILSNCLLCKQGYLINSSTGKCSSKIILIQIQNYYDSFPALSLRLFLSGIFQKYFQLSTIIIMFKEKELKNVNNQSFFAFIYQKINNFFELTACLNKCLFCTDSKNCSVCKYPNTSPPDCNCSLTNQYLDSNNQCQFCSQKCSSCSEISKCDSCSENRLLPSCNCDPQYFDQNLSNENDCIPLVCSSKCAICESTPDNCKLCGEGRETEPDCLCKSKYFEQNEICITCKPHQFQDQNECKNCNQNCRECKDSSTKCSECFEGTSLQNNICLCSDLSSFILTSTGVARCKTFMNVNASVNKIDGKFKLIFEFDEDLDSLDFGNLVIDSLVYLYIQNLPNESYSVIEPEISGRFFRLTFKFQTSFQQTQGQVTFLNTKIFQNSEKFMELDTKYQTNSLSFKVGPLLISPNEGKGGDGGSSGEGNQSQQSLNKSMQQMADYLSNNNSTSLAYIRSFQVVFYAVNTLQPCLSFLMVRITLPENLQVILKVPGLLVFPTVEDSFSPSQNNQFELFGHPLRGEKEISINSSPVFQRIGFSNCIIVNIMITLVQNLVWFMIYILIVGLSLLKVNVILDKIKAFVFKKINGNIEVGLLVISVSVFNQFLNVDSNQILNRISLYLSFVIIFLLVAFHKTIYKLLIIDKKNQALKESPLRIMILSIIDKLNFERNPAQASRFYFMQLSKKYFLSAILVFLEKYPSCVCGAASMLFFFSCITTIYIRPYKTFMSNLTKIIGESLMVTIWMIFLFKFVPFQKYFLYEQKIPDEEIKEYLYYGKVVLYLIIAFNAIYIFELIWNSIILKIYAHLITLKTQRKQERNAQDIEDQLQRVKIRN